MFFVDVGDSPPLAILVPQPPNESQQGADHSSFSKKKEKEKALQRKGEN